jgi:hypothetical protein
LPAAAAERIITGQPTRSRFSRSGDNVQRLRRFAAAWVAISVLFLSFACDEPSKVVEPPAGPAVNDAQSEDALIQLLSKAYTEQDCELFEDLFPAPEDSVEYTFFPSFPINGVDTWGLDRELRIHRAMFRCDSILPPSDLWLVSISISLSRIALWVESTDLYRSPSNPSGLDPARWRATEAQFHADILFETQGETDYRVDGRQDFVVIQDLQKSPGARRRYLIYRWSEPDGFPYSRSMSSLTVWSAVRSMYQW